MDSLDLDDLSESDRELIETSLKEYHSAKDDTSMVNALNDICENMMHQDWEKYQFYQYEIIKTALENSPNQQEIKILNKLLGRTLNNLGFIKMYTGDYSNAIIYFNKSINYAIKEKDNKGLATSLNNLAIIYDDQANIPFALKYYHKSLIIFEEIGDEYGTANAYNNLGLIYLNQQEYNSADKYLKKCIKLREKLKDNLGLSQTYNNIGLLYDKLGKKNKVITNYSKSLEYATLIDAKREMAQASLNLGGVYQTIDSLKQAEKYILQSIALRKAINDRKGLSLSYTHLGNLYFKTNNKINNKKAKEYGLLGFKLSSEIGFPEAIKKSTNVLHLVNERLGNHKEALKYYKLHIQMRDSINNEETQKAAIRQQTQYEFEKEQIRKENEAKEQARIEAEELKRRNNIEYSLIFLGILLLFGIILSLGFIKVSPNIAEGLIFFAFLIFFEFLLVFTEPYLEQYTQGEPVYALLANSALALLIFPLHSLLESRLKKRIVKS